MSAPSGPDAELAELDRRLVELRRLVGDAATELVRLDADRERFGFDSGRYSGATATRWQSAAPLLTQAWAAYLPALSRLEEASKVRGTGQKISRGDLARLGALLCRPDLELDESAAVLIGAACCDVLPVAQAVVASLAEARALLVEITAASDALLGPATASAALLAELTAVAPDDPAVRAVTAELDGLLGTAAADPLSVSPAAFNAVDAKLVGVRARASSAAELRSFLVNRLAALPSELDELEVAQQQAESTRLRAVEKVVDVPALLLATVGASAVIGLDVRAVRVELAGLRALADAGSFGALPEQVGSVTQRVRRARAASDELVATAQGLLAERTELRGRLAGFRVKAVARGLAEGQQLERMFARADGLLSVAPCELGRARQAVAAYVTAVNATLADTGPLRESVGISVKGDRKPSRRSSRTR